MYIDNNTNAIHPLSTKAEKNGYTHFQKTLDKVQNSKQEIKADTTPYSKLKPEAMAQSDFEMALKALDKLVDYKTGESVDFDSLNEKQQKHLLEHLASNLNFAQHYYDDRLEYSKIYIAREEKYIWAYFDYQNSKGEAVDVGKDIFKLEDCQLGTLPLGDDDARRELWDLAKDYVDGNTDNYFGFLKRTRGENDTGLNLKDLRDLEQTIRDMKKEAQEKGLDEKSYLALPFIRLEPSASGVLYHKALDTLIERFFEQKKLLRENLLLNNYERELKNQNPKKTNEIINEALNAV
ncbi:hypothetical protein [Campylobacter sp. VTCC 70190]|uniref:hypothetical protein n=1 Tax=Campylobacter sp. VTCC 70190 TaxID=3392118 RepID=UPI00398E6A92